MHSYSESAALLSTSVLLLFAPPLELHSELHTCSPGFGRVRQVVPYYYVYPRSSPSPTLLISTHTSHFHFVPSLHSHRFYLLPLCQFHSTLTLLMTFLCSYDRNTGKRIYDVPILATGYIQCTNLNSMHEFK